VATCTTEDLLSEASCFACYPDGQQKLMQLVLLCRWLKVLDPMADCSPQGLLDDAACLGCHTPGEWVVIQTQLLCEILHAGGGSGNSCLLCGDVDPVADPDCDCARYYNNLTGADWIWDDAFGIWRKISGP
jgi:hypothetical protein